MAAAAGHDALRCWPHLDERSAAFFALGLAKASRAPVALLCTSGTAAVNFHPAVVEAYYARVPLIVLSDTADAIAAAGQPVGAISGPSDPLTDLTDALDGAALFIRDEVEGLAYLFEAIRNRN